MSVHVNLRSTYRAQFLKFFYAIWHTDVLLKMAQIAALFRRFYMERFILKSRCIGKSGTFKNDLTKLAE